MKVCSRCSTPYFKFDLCPRCGSSHTMFLQAVSEKELENFKLKLKQLEPDAETEIPYVPVQSDILDDNPGTLLEKLVGGEGISLEVVKVEGENGSKDRKIKISADIEVPEIDIDLSQIQTDTYKVKLSQNDTAGFLPEKLEAGSGITLTQSNGKVVVTSTFDPGSINVNVDATRYYSMSKQVQYPIPEDKVYLLNRVNPSDPGVTRVTAVTFVAEGGTSIQFSIKKGSNVANSNLIPTQNITVGPLPTQILLSPQIELTTSDSIWVEVIGTVGNVKLLSIDIHLIAETI